MKPHDDTVTSRHLQVTPRPNESPEQMIRRFGKKVRSDGVLKEYITKSVYEKPSDKARRERRMRDRNRRTDTLEDK